MIEQVQSQQNSPADGTTPSASETPPAAGASPTTPTQQLDSQTQSAAPQRPEWMPETAWDAEKGANLEKLGAEYKALAEFKAAEEARKATLPQKPEDYKTELPKDFKLPDDMRINENDPMWAQGKQLAQKLGLTQEQFGELAKTWVSNQVAQAAHVKELLSKRDASLGPNGAERVQSVQTWADGFFPDKQMALEVKSGIVTANQVKAWEQIRTALVNQGVTSFSNAGREGGQSSDAYPEGFENWTFEKKMAFHRNRSAGVN